MTLRFQLVADEASTPFRDGSPATRERRLGRPTGFEPVIFTFEFCSTKSTILELFLLYLTYDVMQAETARNGTERHRNWEELRGGIPTDDAPSAAPGRATDAPKEA